MRLGLLRIPKGKTVSRAIKIAPVLRPWLQEFGERAGWRGPVVESWGSCRRDLKPAVNRANEAAAEEAAELGIDPPRRSPT